MDSRHRLSLVLAAVVWMGIGQLGVAQQYWISPPDVFTGGEAAMRFRKPLSAYPAGYLWDSFCYEIPCPGPCGREKCASDGGCGMIGGACCGGHLPGTSHCLHGACSHACHSHSPHPAQQVPRTITPASTPAPVARRPVLMRILDLAPDLPIVEGERAAVAVGEEDELPVRRVRLAGHESAELPSAEQSAVVVWPAVHAQTDFTPSESVGGPAVIEMPKRTAPKTTPFLQQLRRLADEEN